MTTGAFEAAPQPLDREQLAAFAGLDPEQKAAGLLSVTRAILATEGAALDALVSPEAADALGTDVETAFTQTAATPYLVNNESVMAWEGPGSAAVMTPDYKVAGMRGGIIPGFEDYGDLRRFCLSKMVQIRALEELGMPGGLLVRRNYAFLRSLGFEPDVELYAGATPGTVTVNGREFLVGTSGCVPREMYARSLVSFMAVGDRGVSLPADIQSGRFDMAFAIGLGNRLQNPQAPITATEEPDCLFDLRMGR